MAQKRPVYSQSKSKKARETFTLRGNPEIRYDKQGDLHTCYIKKGRKEWHRHEGGLSSYIRSLNKIIESHPEKARPHLEVRREFARRVLDEGFAFVKKVESETNDLLSGSFRLKGKTSRLRALADECKEWQTVQPFWGWAHATENDLREVLACLKKDDEYHARIGLDICRQVAHFKGTQEELFRVLEIISLTMIKKERLKKEDEKKFDGILRDTMLEVRVNTQGWRKPDIPEKVLRHLRKAVDNLPYNLGESKEELKKACRPY